MATVPTVVAPHRAVIVYPPVATVSDRVTDCEYAPSELTFASTVCGVPSVPRPANAADSKTTCVHGSSAAAGATVVVEVVDVAVDAGTVEPREARVVVVVAADVEVDDAVDDDVAAVAALSTFPASTMSEP